MKGYDDALALKQLMVSPRVELAQDAAEELDTILRSFSPGDRIEAVYYQDHGYTKTAGIFRRLSVIDQVLYMDDVAVSLRDLLCVKRLTNSP